MSASIQLENTVMPLLREAEKAVRTEYPQFKFNTGSSSIGGLTTYQGHHVWLECTFPDAADHEADSVAVMVGIKHITTEPMLCEASVEWGYGQHPELSLELLQQPIMLTEQALQDTVARLPKLLGTFRNAIQAWVVRAIT